MDCNKHVRIDLHIHTTASDGTMTPAEVISHADRLKLKAISITDHDTVAGSEEAFRCGIPPSLDFLTGVEISAAPPLFYPVKKKCMFCDCIKWKLSFGRLMAFLASIS